MKIGIITLPLHTNYGGILQAYALRHTLQKLGHQAKVFGDYHLSILFYIIYPLICLKRIYKKYILKQPDIEIFTMPHIRVRMHTDRFIKTYIDVKRIRTWNKNVAKGYDAFIVGSDQVWRPRYFISGKRPNIELAFLSFAEGINIKRIAYAASFGTDENEYTPEQLQTCSALLKQFDAISVRESSAVANCKERFGVNAIHLLDPTMLLSREDYIQLFQSAHTPKSKGNLMCYILDETSSTTQFIKEFEKKHNLKAFRSNSKVEDPNAPISERIQPPVESWLRSFYDAAYVITDSFHACVFSILFHKPFICIGNQGRGMSRFHSLLKMFNLTNRLVDINHLESFQDAPINWDEVDEILESKRKESMTFLKNALTVNKKG